jgi:ATP-dependent RNA helicase DeaD
MKTFTDFHLSAVLTDSLQTLGFVTPTPIQAQAIPHAMEGRDILGSAQTGTGKTGAFMLPLLNRLIENPQAQALVMTPTRELASQVMDMTRKLMGQKSGIRTALLIGGEPMHKQFKQLDNRPRLIIGTPGRIDDHCRRNRGLLDQMSMLVLDEADRMLDMGFSVQIDSILKYMPQERQTLLFSATFAGPIVKFAQRYLNNPVRVEIKADKITADKIKHEVVHTTTDKKFDQLQSELSTREGSVIIFVKTRRNADQLAKRLSYIEHADFRAEPIHGDLRQRQRDRTIQDFRSSRFRILVATDVASRGLDIPHIEHVINYDLPQNPEDYVHRIGRTARAGAEGSAVCLLTPSDNRNWGAIQRLVFPGQAPASNSNYDNAGPRRGSGKPNRNAGGASRYNKEGGKSFGNDRSRKFAEGDRAPRSNDRPQQGGFKKKYDDRGPRPERSNGDRPAFENRGPRPERSNGDRPAFENRVPRPERNNNGDRPAFEQRGERPAFKKRDDRPSDNRGFKKREDGSSDNRNFKKRDDRAVDGNRFEHNEGRADNPKRDTFNADRPRPKYDGPKRENGQQRSEGKKQGSWQGGKDRPAGEAPYKKKPSGPFKGRPASSQGRSFNKSNGPKRAA